MGLAKKVDDDMFDQPLVKPVIGYAKWDKCIRRCAPGVVSVGKDGFPSIDDKECIRCYCREKYCPYGVVTLRGSVVNHPIRAVRVITGM